MKPPSRIRPASLVVGLLLLAQLACSLSNPTPAVWVLTPTALARAATATARARALATEALPLPTFTITPSLVPATPTPVITELNPAGPWLVYPSDGGDSLVALNPDGSGLTRLGVTLLDTNDLVDGLAPQGGVVALRTGRRSDFSSLGLVLVHFPSGQIDKITPLLSPDLQALANSGDSGQRTRLAAQAVSGRGALRWSPDGRYLAFLGAIDGDSSDLYLFDTSDHSLSRLTTGSNQAATPIWSPGGQMVITQEFEAYLPAGGFNPTAVWTTNISSKETVRVYTPPANSTGEIFAGWLGDEQLLTYSQGAQGGFDLRRVDIVKIKDTTLFPGPFGELSFEPESKTTALTGVAARGATSGLPNGLYLLPAESSDPTPVEGGDWRDLRWEPQNKLFTARGVLGILWAGLDGHYNLLQGEAAAALSPSGSWVAAWGQAPDDTHPGLRLYKPGGELLQTITGDSIQDLAWLPGSNGFFYLSGSRLYRVEFPQLQPRLIDEAVQPGQEAGLTWIH